LNSGFPAYKLSVKTDNRFQQFLKSVEFHTIINTYYLYVFIFFKNTYFSCSWLNTEIILTVSDTIQVNF